MDAKLLGIRDMSRAIERVKGALLELGTRTAICCDSLEDMKILFAVANSIGMKHYTGAEWNSDHQWHVYGVHYYYSIDEGRIRPKNWYKENGYKIITVHSLIHGETLKEGDEVQLGVYTYSVLENHLSLNSIAFNNDQIFNDLELCSLSFCREHYGYAPGDGSWPTCKNGDYPALTRAVNALKDLIKEKQTKSGPQSIGVDCPIIKSRFFASGCDIAAAAKLGLDAGAKAAKPELLMSFNPSTDESWIKSAFNEYEANKRLQPKYILTPDTKRRIINTLNIKTDDLFRFDSIGQGRGCPTRRTRRCEATGGSRPTGRKATNQRERERAEGGKIKGRRVLAD